MERFSEASNSFNVDLQRGDLVLLFQKFEETTHAVIPSFFVGLTDSHRLGLGTKFFRNLVATLCCWRMSLYSLQYTDLEDHALARYSSSELRRSSAFQSLHIIPCCALHFRPWSNSSHMLCPYLLGVVWRGLIGRRTTTAGKDNQKDLIVRRLLDSIDVGLVLHLGIKIHVYESGQISRRKIVFVTHIH